MKDLTEFGKSLKKLAAKSIDEFKQESIQEFADQLRKLLRSGKASMSARKLNNLFSSRNHVDDDGNPISVASPADIADKIVIVDDVIMIALTQDEDRWFRADSIFGDNILSELGIKYRQR